MNRPVLLSRRAVRALLLAEDHLLLMQMEFPWREGPIWIAPGGGLASGESLEAGVRREIFEETGLRDLELGPKVWEREFELDSPSHSMRQHEVYFLVRTTRFVPVPAQFDAQETRTFREFRWWPLHELPLDASVDAGADLHDALISFASSAIGRK